MTIEFIDHNWEKHYTLKPNDIYVEAGAYRGTYGKIASLKGCKVILIEPDPVNVKFIIKNIESIKFMTQDNKTQDIKTQDNKTQYNKIDLKEVVIIYAAIGSKKGKMLIKSLSSKDVEVNVLTLDSILKESMVDHIDLLCCDIEGYEIDLLKGSSEYLSQGRIKNVALACYHKQEYPEMAINILKEHKFNNLVYEEGVVYGNV